MKTSSTVLLGLALFATAQGQLPGATAEATRPNIIFIYTDDQSFEALSVVQKELGQKGRFPWLKTPNMDRIAAEGVRFRNAFVVNSLCSPSCAANLTGRYNHLNGIASNFRAFPTNNVTCATLLRAAGYTTAYVGKWHLGFREEGYYQPLRSRPVDCGIDTFWGLRASTDIPPYLLIWGDCAVMPPTNQIAEHHSEGWSPSQGAFWRGGSIAAGLELKDVLPKLTDEACAVIKAQALKKANASQPLLLYLALTAPHTPWLSAAEFAGKSGAGMYGDFVMMVDAQIGRVVAALKQADMTRNTLLIYTSDNGPKWQLADVERFGQCAFE